MMRNCKVSWSSHFVCPGRGGTSLEPGRSALSDLRPLQARSALKMVAIFLLFLAGNIVIDSVVLAHKVFAVVQPPHLAWLHEWVPQFLDPVLVYQVKNYEV